MFPPIKRNVLSVTLPDKVGGEKEAEEDFIYSTLLFMFTLCFALQGRLTPGFDQICSMRNFLNCIIPASSSPRGFLLNWGKSDFTHGWALNPFDFRLEMQFSQSSIIYKGRSFSVSVGEKKPLNAFVKTVSIFTMCLIFKKTCRGFNTYPVWIDLPITLHASLIT